MDFKTFRKRAFLIHERIKDKEAHLEEIRERATHCTSSWDQAPGKALGSRVEIFSAQACELEKQLTQLKEWAAEIDGILSQLEPTHKVVIECRYIYDDCWASIAHKVHRRHDHVRGWLKKKALEDLEKILCGITHNHT